MPSMYSDKNLQPMNFMLDPPTRVRPGAIFNPPVVIRIDRPTCNKTALDPSLLWAFVSITDEAGKISLAPPRNDLIIGNLSDSVHVLDSDAESEDEDEFGYLSFPDIAIRDPGNYRLKISLMELDVQGGRGAKNKGTLESDVIRVECAAKPGSLGESSSRWNKKDGTEHKQIGRR
jgi:hypothetical protein